MAVSFAKSRLAILAEQEKQINLLLHDVSREAGRVWRQYGDTTIDGVRARYLQQQTQALLKTGWNGVSDLIDKNFMLATEAAGDTTRAQFAERMRYLLDGDLSTNLETAMINSQALTTVAGIEKAVVRIQGLSTHTLSERVYKTQALASGWLDNQINIGLARGESAAQLAARVQGAIDPAVPGGPSYAAKRLARTEINNAFHAATIQNGFNNPFCIGMKWETSGSHPRADVCDEYEEQSSGPGWESGEYRLEDVPEKPHPHCLCYITPIADDDDVFLDKLTNGDYDDYLAKNGGFPVGPQFSASVPPELKLTSAEKAMRTRFNKAKASKPEASDDVLLADIQAQYGGAIDDLKRTLASLREKQKAKEELFRGGGKKIQVPPEKPPVIEKPTPKTSSWDGEIQVQGRAIGRYNKRNGVYTYEDAAGTVKTFPTKKAMMDDIRLQHRGPKMVPKSTTAEPKPPVTEPKPKGQVLEEGEWRTPLDDVKVYERSDHWEVRLSNGETRKLWKRDDWQVVRNVDGDVVGFTRKVTRTYNEYTPGTRYAYGTSKETRWDTFDLHGKEIKGSFRTKTSAVERLQGSVARRVKTVSGPPRYGRSKFFQQKMKRMGESDRQYVDDSIRQAENLTPPEAKPFVDDITLNWDYQNAGFRKTMDNIYGWTRQSYATQGRGVWMNSRITMFKRGRDELSKVRGFKVPQPGGINAYAKVLLHETGHQMGYATQGARLNGTLFSTRFEEELRKALPEHYFTNGTSEFYGLSQSRVSSTVSRYGSTNQYEMQAEMWAEYCSWQGNPPGTVAKIYGDLVIEYIKFGAMRA